jgi:hypothetical protein
VNPYEAVQSDSLKALPHSGGAIELKHKSPEVTFLGVNDQPRFRDALYHDVPDALYHDVPAEICDRAQVLEGVHGISGETLPFPMGVSSTWCSSIS